MKNKARIAIYILFYVLAASSLTYAADYPLNLRLSHYDEELVQLEWEIKTLNLINGLYLNEEQIENMLEILNALSALNQRYESKLIEAKEKTKQAYAVLRDDLVDDDMVYQESERTAGSAKHQLEDLVLKYSKQLVQLEADLFDVFSEKQLAIADQFVPCIIPPKSGNNTRIGQTSGSNEHLENMLERLRNIPELQFQQMLPTFIARQIENLETKHGVLGHKERDEIFDRLYDLALDIRQMDDLEFEVKKSELAAQLKPPSLDNKNKNQTKPKNNSKARRKKYQLSVVGSFLLNEKLIPILEEKLGY